MRRQLPMTGRAGLSLVELVLAAGMLSVLTLALLTLLDTTLEILRKTDARRDKVESASAMGDLLRRDLVALENGPRGDLWADWAFLDGDKDGTTGGAYARLRFGRRATDAEVLRLQARYEGEGGARTSAQPDPMRGEGLLEISWALMPRVTESPTRTVDRVLWRGERIVGDPDSISHLDERFFDAAGRAPAGAMEEVSGGVLWFGMSFATQTSTLWDGWSFGETLADCTHQWDAWTRERPDRDTHVWNEPHVGMPRADEHPVLPRRVRVELTVERQSDLKRRTTLDQRLESDQNTLFVRHADRLPAEGDYLLVDEEWMRVRDKAGRRVSVERGVRGSRALPHDADALVHYGPTLRYELPVRLYREDWNL